jgi:hypothetical protein
MVGKCCDIIGCDLEQSTDLSAWGRPVSQSERELRSPGIHVGLLSWVAVVDLEPASPALASRAVVHVPPQASGLRPLQELRRRALEAVGMAHEERAYETSAGKGPGRHRTAGRIGRVEGRGDRHAGLDLELALHIDGQVAEERSSGRRLGALAKPGHQLGDAVGDATESGHGEGLANSDVRLRRPLDDLRHALKAAHTA